MLTTDPRARLAAWQPGLWRFRWGSGTAALAGVIDRWGDLSVLERAVPGSHGIVGAGQIHGASIAAVERPSEPVPGCDALVTQARGLVLVCRSADCLPIWVEDPHQRLIGLAHVGWRGLVRHLPLRLVAFLTTHYHCNPAHLRIGIGPAIGPCCYEVGPDFPSFFSPFLRQDQGRQTCDLVACARQQVLSAGVLPRQITQAGICTSCDNTRWFSVRREGEHTGRNVSLIVLPP